MPGTNRCSFAYSSTSVCTIAMSMPRRYLRSVKFCSDPLPTTGTTRRVAPSSTRLARSSAILTEMPSPTPNSRSPLANSDAVSADDGRGCAGGGGSIGTTGTGVAAGAVTGADLSGAAEVFGGAPFDGSRLATAGFESDLAGAGLLGAAVAACGDGAAGTGKSVVGTRPEGCSPALRLGGAAAFPPVGP